MSRNRALSICLSASAALVVLLLLACGSDPEPTPTLAPTETPVPPTATPRPTPTPPPTALPTPEPGPARQSFIPEGATVVIEADPSSILGSPMLESLLGAIFGDSGVGPDLFEKFQSETGIPLTSMEDMEAYVDFADVLDATMGEPGDGNSGMPDLGIALQGGITEDELAGRLTGANGGSAGLGYEETSYRGYSLYVDAEKDSGKFVFAFAEPGTLLVGSDEGVMAMLDVAAGVVPQVSGEGLLALEELGAKDVGLMMAIPEEALEEAMEEGDGPGNPLALLGLGGLTPELTVAALSFEGRSVRVHSVEVYEDDATAVSAKEYNEGTLAMMGAMLGSAEIQQVIAESEIKQDGNRVSYRLDVDEPTVLGILDFLTSFLGMGLSS